MLIKIGSAMLTSFLVSIISFSQSPNNKIHDLPINKQALEKKLDSLFSSYNKNTPGVAVTVLENGKVVAAKSYGMASLEFDVPFSHNTIVRLPYAEGREFISIAATMMEEEGLISFNDEVRKYYPKLPAWSEPVTIRHLLNHSSGFDDEWSVLLLTQANMGNTFDVTQFLNLLYNQPSPAIEPGKGYMYCNSDFGLLRLILEKASGKNLSEWMKQKIFDPLEMHSTRLHDNKDEVISGFAHEYNEAGRRQYSRHTNDKTSPGGNYYIATSAADLEKWARIHANPGSFASKAIQYMKRDARLMPGKGKNYVFGIKEQNEDGYTLITHQGVNNRPYLSRYPAKGYAVIIIGNSDADYVQNHKNIMNWLVGVQPVQPRIKQFKRTPVKYTPAEMQRFAGRYFDADTLGYESFTKDRKHLLEFVVHNDSLKLKLNNTTFIPLESIAPNVFKDSEYEAYLEFILPVNKSEPLRINTYINLQNKIYYHIQDTSVLWKPAREDLLPFTGKYYSPHLDFYWTLLLNESGSLMVKRPTISDRELIPETKDLFTLMVDKSPGAAPFEVFVKFQRDEAGKITHFTVSDPRLMHHRFEKL